jgi:hypothetical protein
MQAISGSSALRGLAGVAGLIAAAIAGAIGLVVALVFAAAVLVIGLFGSILLAFAGLAMRARRSSKPQPAKAGDADVIEARRVGGHSWVAYGWDNRR